VDVPASGQISNVSAFVLPEDWPVADDGQQLPMFLHGSQDPGRDLLVHVVDVQAEAIRNLTGLLQLAGLLKDQPNGHVPEAESEPKHEPKRRSQNKLHRPQNKLFREWHTFRAHFQHLEKVIRRDHQLLEADQVTREMVCTDGGIPPKTLRYHMEWHGLRPEQWPPSTWPETAPPRPADA